MGKWGACPAAGKDARTQLSQSKSLETSIISVLQVYWTFAPHPSPQGSFECDERKMQMKMKMQGAAVQQTGPSSCWRLKPPTSRQGFHCRTPSRQLYPRLVDEDVYDLKSCRTENRSSAQKKARASRLLRPFTERHTMFAARCEAT